MDASRLQSMRAMRARSYRRRDCNGQATDDRNLNVFGCAMRRDSLCRLVGGAGQIKVTKDGKVLLDEMVRTTSF